MKEEKKKLNQFDEFQNQTKCEEKIMRPGMLVSKSIPLPGTKTWTSCTWTDFHLHINFYFFTWYDSYTNPYRHLL